MNQPEIEYVKIPIPYFRHLIQCEERCNILERMVQDDQVVSDSDLRAIFNTGTFEEEEIPSC